MSITEAVDHVLEAFRPQFQAKNITVEARFSYEDRNVQLKADPHKLSQVINNLVHNALQYTNNGGTLRVSLERSEGAAKVVFANTGGDLSEQDLPFIFERFYRGEKSRSREHGGAGIGLAIVKELIEAHGGSVGAEVTHGETHIWFFLPA
jgi:signal transduction histidine kinase